MCEMMEVGNGVAVTSPADAPKALQADKPSSNPMNNTATITNDILCIATDQGS